jgi:2-polyprenyl-3-methyl-5-hydroxy-6-metoxy-1,4-benzoquinol methylase
MSEATAKTRLTVTPADAPAPRFKDRLALWLLKLAKLRRREFTATEGEEYDKFYEAFFDEKDLELYEKDRRLVVRRQTLLDTLNRLAPQDAEVLDVGCGLGDVLASMPKTYRLSGMDYAAHNVNVATRRLAGRATIVKGSIYEIPFEANRFDVALCLEVLEHIEDDARGVRDIARVLKPRGFLIAAVPYTYYWPQYRSLMGHFRHYTRTSFAKLLDDNGLKTEAFLPNYPNWHQTYTRRYAMIRAKATTFGRLLGRRSIYSFKWPWQREPAIDALARKLEPLRQRDAQLDYAAIPTSTFILARKPA